MTNSKLKTRLHVHWGMKAIAIIGILMGLLNAYLLWQIGATSIGLINLFITVFSLYVLFLANTKIDVDQNEIRIIAPHGEYVMSWDEITAVEKNKSVTIFFSKDKAIAYNLLLAGKGKLEFQNYIDKIIAQRKFEIGRPRGITNSEVQKLMKKTQVRGWKLV